MEQQRLRLYADIKKHCIAFVCTVHNTCTAANTSIKVHSQHICIAILKFYTVPNYNHTVHFYTHIHNYSHMNVYSFTVFSSVFVALSLSPLSFILSFDCMFVCKIENFVFPLFAALCLCSCLSTLLPTNYFLLFVLQTV